MHYHPLVNCYITTGLDQPVPSAIGSRVPTPGQTFKGDQIAGGKRLIHYWSGEYFQVLPSGFIKHGWLENP